MWLFLPIGFFSVVQKPGDSFLTVRARVSSDLDNLRTLVPELGETIHTPRNDYPYRATVSHEALAAGIGKLILAIDYDNFKAEVSRRQGFRRADVYHDVWAKVRGLVYVSEMDKDQMTFLEPER